MCVITWVEVLGYEVAVLPFPAPVLSGVPCFNLGARTHLAPSHDYTLRCGSKNVCRVPRVVLGTCRRHLGSDSGPYIAKASSLSAVSLVSGVGLF